MFETTGTIYEVTLEVTDTIQELEKMVDRGDLLVYFHDLHMLFFEEKDAIRFAREYFEMTKAEMKDKYGITLDVFGGTLGGDIYARARHGTHPLAIISYHIGARDVHSYEDEG